MDSQATDGKVAKSKYEKDLGEEFLMDRRILVLAPFFSLKSINRPAFVSRVLSDLGSVDVVTTDFDHLTKSKKQQTQCTYIQDIFYLKTLHYKNNTSIQRFFSHIIFSFSAIRFFLKRRKKYDVIYVSVPFNLLAWLVCLFAKKQQRIIDIIDIWPDVLPFSNRSRQATQPVMALWKYFFIKAVNQCDTLMAVSDSFLNGGLKYFGENNGSARRFYIGADEFPLVEVKKAETRTIVYVGNIGMLYDFETLIEALSSPAMVDKWQLYIVGDGDRREWLISELIARGIPHHYFGVVYDSIDLATILYQAHIGFNGYTDKTSAAFSYKANTYMAAGLPIINSMQGDLHDIVDGHKVGFNYKPGDVGELVNRLGTLDNSQLEYLSRKTKDFFNNELNRKQLHEDIKGFLIDEISK